MWMKYMRWLFGQSYGRVSKQNPRNDLPCEWCKQVRPTDEGEVWAGVNPEGRIVRLCHQCASYCAGG